MGGPGYFRLFLAALVFLHHSSRLHLGTFAVYIFFILSGYWIGIFLLGIYFGHLSSIERLPYTFATWIAVFAATIVIYAAVDRPSEALRRRFVHARKANGR